ncbi:hypothetical protein LAV45_18370, partial [Clostridium sporogenes]|nr:hypothetical protein [Clostridium sporogenes]
MYLTKGKYIIEKIREERGGNNTMNFVISTGNSRKDKLWKKQSVTWGDFTEKLSHTTVTSETQAEYKKMKKFQQDNVKDVGGFVAGELKDGRRKKENVLSRS